MKRYFIILVLLVLAVTTAAVEKKTIEFSADRMSGTSGKKNGTTGLEGNAKVTIETLEITGDRIDLSGTEFRYVEASGNVKGIDAEKGFSFSADFLSYDRDTEVASFRGNAKLLDTKNEVETSAGMIIYNQQTEIAFLQIDVNLKRREIVCTSSFATYRRSLSLLDLSGNPLVIRDGDEFRADRISVNLETEHITLDGSVSGSIKDTKKVEKKEEPQ